MKKIIYTIFIMLLNSTTYAQEGVYKYLTQNVIGGDYEITLTLKANKEFLYSAIDDQLCYANKYVSLGKWEHKGENIILNVADSLQPKINIKEPFLKKDTLTIFFKKMDDCNLLEKASDKTCYDIKDKNYFNYYYDRDLHFYDKNNKEIFIYGIQNSEKIEIPMNKEIDKIDFYFPNDWSPNSTKLSVNISEKTGQIYITNLSRYLKANFINYTFLLKKKSIVMSGSHLKKAKLKQQRQIN